MSDNDNSTTTMAEQPAGEPGEVLRAQEARLTQQLLELESDLEGMLREHDTIQEDLDQARAVIEGVRTDLQLMQRAIGRLEAGTYGQCVDCGAAIAPARLEAIPEVERCSNCA